MTDADIEFLGLERTNGGATLAVVPRLCTPFDFLYGGSGLAACAVAAESVTGRPLKWITTQYVSNARPGETLTIDVDVVADGHATSQTHVRAAVGERTVLHATTAHSTRPGGDEAWWGGPPEVAGPDESPKFELPFDLGDGDSIDTVMERRLPPQPDGFIEAGRLAMWTHVDGWPIGSPASQGFVADVVLMALTAALGRSPGGTSLDNTMRVVMDEPGHEWVLLDIEAEGRHHGIGHGRVRVWGRDGSLLGIGSQSAIVRTSHHDRHRV